MIRKDITLSELNQRDLSILSLNEDRYLVIGCDSAGGVGPKEGDQLQVPAAVVGRFTARVPLMEVKAVGAEIINVIDTLSVELKPTGEDILRGIGREVKLLGLEPADIINGSTEENMKTIQTGVGVTVLGTVNRSQLKLATSQKGNIIAAVGYPSVGEEVLPNEERIADLQDVITLLGLNYINEILPVGSKGVRYEAEVLAQTADLTCHFSAQLDFDLDKSAGPATVLLVSLPHHYLRKLKYVMNKPVSPIGYLK